MINNIKRTFQSSIFWIIMALVVGGVIAGFFVFIARPQVGIIRISGSILFPWEGQDIVEMIRYAKEKKRIKAVVLEIDSPGGEASLIEEIYLNLLQLKKEKPIVASINQQGASGGYYIALPTNYIFAKPDSELGSIGAWASLPWKEEPSEDILPTGPFKDTGMTQRKAVGQLEMLKQSFLQVVSFHRGDKLKLSQEQLSKAEVYTGLEGWRLGLIDEIGSGFEAIEKAAKIGGIAHYKVVDVERKMAEEEASSGKGLMTATSTKEKIKKLLPSYYYLIE